MKRSKRLSIVGMVGVLGLTALFAQADTVVFSDDFTGADGAALTDGNWGYVDLGYLGPDSWAVLTRTVPEADVFEIKSNRLYTEITPLQTTNIAVRNKVMASIYPKSDDSQLAVPVSDGEKFVCELDLAAFTHNQGHMWSLHQELKLVLRNAAGNFADPGKKDGSLMFRITVRPEGDENLVTISGTDYRSTENDGVSTGAINVTDIAELPLSLRLEHHSNGDTVFLVNDTVLGSLSGPAFATVHPYIWRGIFNGAGSELSQGSMTIDNFEITTATSETTVPDAATDFDANQAGEAVELSWTDVATDELSYRVERMSGTNAYAQIAVVASDSTGYTDTDVSAGTTYDYRLTAFNAVGDSTSVETSETVASADPFVAWATTNGLTGSKENTVDSDDDGASDYREYALNGNPTNSADTGMVEEHIDGSTFTYVYLKRTDDPSVVYTLINTADLVSGPDSTNDWTTQTIGVSGVDNFNVISNHYEMESKQFFKLIVE